MKLTYKELQEKVAELEQMLANCTKKQDKIGSLEDWHRIFEAVVSQSPGAILITNDQGKIEYVNEAFHQTLGYSPDELQDDFMFSIMKDNEDITKYEELKDIIQKGGIWRGELKEIRKDQQVIWIRLLIFPLVHEGRIKNYVAIFNDITDIKVIEAGRQEQQAFYKKLIDNIPLSISIIDEEGRVLYNNENTEKIFNQSRDKTIGKTFHQILPEKTADDLMDQYRQIFKTGQSMNTVTNFIWHGQMLNLNVTRLPLFNDQGKITRIMTLLQNVTEKVRHEQHLQIQHQIDSLSNISSDLKSSLDLAFQHLM